MNTVVYSIPKFHCDHCLHTIESELSEVAGVETVTASLGEKKVMIRFADPADEEKLKSVLAEINYPVAA